MRKPPTCKECGAPLRFIKTPKGSWMPVDLKPVYFFRFEGGSHKLVTQDGYLIEGEIVGDKPEHGTKLASVPHWESCPGAAKFKARRESAARAAATQNAAGEKEAAAKEQPQAEQLSCFAPATRKER